MHEHPQTPSTQSGVTHLSTGTAFSLQGLKKTYGAFTLGPLDLDLQPGRVLAYIGPNGAGKTTTMHCLAGLLRPDAGQITVLGHPIDPRDPSWKQDIAYVGETQGFYERSSGAENLRFLARWIPNLCQERAACLATRLQLSLEQPVASLSKGNRTKLALVAALAREPRLLLLDEPTDGLDPITRSELLAVLWELLENGESAIFYSTHTLSDIARLADELAFLRDGELVQRQSKEELVEAWRRISFRLATPGHLKLDGTYAHRQDSARHQLLASDHEATSAQLNELQAEDLEMSRLTVEEIAIAILRGEP